MGKTVTLSVKVVDVDPAELPGGTVNFLVGSTVLGSGTIVQIGASYQAALDTAALPAGSDKVTAVYAGDTDTSSTSSAFTIAVSKLAITVTPTSNQTKVYGASDPTLAYTSSPALIGDDQFSGQPGPVLRATPMGTYAISQGTLALSGNYSITVATGFTFAITVDAIAVTPTSGQSKTYGDIDPTLAYTVSPPLVGSDAFTGSLSRGAGENVGNYAINQGSLALSSNYSITFTTGVDFGINTRTMTVTPTSGLSKVYGDSDPALTYSYSPSLAFADAFSGGLNRVSGENAGAYLIEQGTLALNSNYSITFNTGFVLSIAAKPITVTPTSGQNKVYGTVDPTLAYTFSPSLIGSDAFSGSLTRSPGLNVGNYAISRGTLRLRSNYTLAVGTGVNFAITQLSITATPSSGQSKVYGTGRSGRWRLQPARRWSATTPSPAT